MQTRIVPEKVNSCTEMSSDETVVSSVSTVIFLLERTFELYRQPNIFMQNIFVYD
jgi:hypothetical protein